VTGVLLYLRLALATGVVLAPGWAIARAVGVRGLAATVAWAFTALFVALAITFLLGAPLVVALVLLLAAGAAALPFARRRRFAEPLPGWQGVAAAGALLGALLWHVAGEIGGDGLFHLARARKLLALDDLSLDAVNEFPDGGLHPGYAFPLWHGFLALVARVAWVDPAEVVLHEPSVLAPVAVVVAYEAAYVLFGRVVPAASAAAAGVALVAMAPGHGGAFTALALPATGSRQILVPTALVLALAAARLPAPGLLASAGAASLVLALVHPTYALFLWVPFAGYVAVRWAWTRAEARDGTLALGALVAPALLFFVALLPVIRDTASVSPSASERERGFAQYAGQLTGSDDRFAVAPELFGRAGAVAVGALLLVPLAALATRRRWAAFVVGGSLAVFLVTLVPPVFTAFADVVSLSQARRLAGFLPFGVAFAGGMGVLAALLGPLALVVSVVLGLVFQLAYSGDFGYVLDGGGPAWATWVAVAGALVALVAGIVRRDRAPRGTAGRLAAWSAALFLLPVFVAGLAEWSPSPGRTPSPLTPGLVQALRGQVPAGDTVYADLESSYRIGAFAPVYVCNNPPGHVADTKQNRPYERRAEARRFFRTGDLAVPRACGARWLVVDRSRFDLYPDLPVVYRDDRYTLYRL
jgi:hypothetical protein